MSRSYRIVIHALVGFVVIGILIFNAVLYYRIRQGGREATVSGAQEAQNETTPVLSLTIISAPECKECFDMREFAAVLEQGGQIEVASNQEVNYDSEEGARIIEQYGIQKVPTILVRGDIETAFDINSFTSNLGTLTDDGALLITNVPPPYLDLVSGQVQGRFAVTYIDDAACEKCYDVNLHKQAFIAIQMKPAEEKFLDRADAEARELIRRYSVTTFPTILMQGQFEVYPQFADIWAAVGTVEQDGTHIFRQGQKLMGAYYDAEKGVVVEPQIEDAGN